MRVVARMSPDLNWGDALEAHPEWAMRYADGSVQHSSEEPALFKTCMFSRYMDDYVPDIMREVNSLYDVDCFYTNGWPPLGSLPALLLLHLQQAPRGRYGSVLARLHRPRRWNCGRNMTRSRRRNGPTASSLPIWEATYAADRISIVWAKLPPGFRLIIRAVPTTTQPFGDAACRAVFAMRCSMARLPPM